MSRIDHLRETAPEVLELLSGLCDDAVNQDELAQLEESAAQDDASVGLVMDYLQLHSDIYFELASRRASAAALREIDARSGGDKSKEPSAAPATEGVVPIAAIPSAQSWGGYFASGWPVAYLVATVILAVGLTIGAIVHVSRPPETAKDSSQSKNLPMSPEERMQLVGRVTAMVDCAWEDRGTETVNGAHVPLNRRYALASGLMEITYDTGAKVLLQGPATYEVESAVGGYLSVGKLTAMLEKKPEVRGQRSEVRGQKSANQKSEITSQKSFAVRTPTAVVTDLGTEFGVEVSKQGGTVTHVFRGLVDVQPVSDGGKRQGKSVQLRAEQSVVVERANGAGEPGVRPTVVKPEGFVRCSELPKLVDDQRLGPFRRWMAYSMELRRDPSLVAYYDFQQKAGEPRVLPNVAVSGGKSPDGVVENATWTTGRMPGKHALRFLTADDRVKLDLPQQGNDLTLAAWVCVETLHTESIDGVPLFNGLLMSENWDRSGQVHWQLDSDGRMCVGHFGIKDGRDARAWRSPPVFGEATLRRWTHLAIVLDRSARVRFFVDGRLAGEDVVDNRQRIPICIGPAWIGGWNQHPRTFNGRIDELAVFGRSLTPDEIGRMFEAGSPAGKGPSRE